MTDPNRERPTNTEDQIDRTGRGEQVAPGFGARGPAKRAELDRNDAPKDGVDSADFAGTAAP